MVGRSWDGHAIEKDVLEVPYTKKNIEDIMRANSVKNHTVGHIATRLSRQPSYSHSPNAPSMNRPIPNNGRSDSPRSSRNFDEDGRNTPSLVSAPTRFSSRHSVGSSSVRDDESLMSFSTLPNYMATTRSSKAKVRSQSTPKQRPDTQEESISFAKKRLSFPCPLKSTRPLGPQRSPSLKGHSGPLKYGRYLDEVSFDSSASWNGDFRRHFR